MKNFGKRITGFLLAFIMAFDFSVPTFSMELLEVPEEAIETEPEYIEEEMEPDELSTYAVDPEKSLEETVREQVEAYVKSIDMENADGKAKDIIVNHGIWNNGKKLSVGKGHALTATIYNSGMMMDILNQTCFELIRSMQQLDIVNVSYIHGSNTWSSSKYRYDMFNRISKEGNNENTDWLIARENPYNGTINSYDKALNLIAGGTDVDMTFERIKVAKSEVTYKITCTVSDRFDFDTSAGLISGFGALLFTEFDWESKVSFNIKVPYSCSHSSGNYHWTFDTENHILVSDNSEEYIENRTKQYSYENSKGEISYYFETDEPVRLFHNKPWVMEYDVVNPRKFSINPFEKVWSRTYSSIVQNYGGTLFFCNQEYYKVSDSKTATAYNHYGTELAGKFGYSKAKPHTFRFENMINPDGSNMVYLTVINLETGNVLLDKIPIDDYYKETDLLELKDESSDWINGKNFYFSYIGNKVARLDVGAFDLRIWENGKDSEPESCFEKGKTTKPTCTEKGYTTYTCSLCGYSYKDNYTAALGHSFGEWETVTAPTAENPGEEKRFCSACEYSETRVVPAIGCTLADANLDGSVNVMDAYFVRLIVAKIVEPTAKQIEMCDVDLDGKITAIDANIIRKYAVGIIKNLPTE